MTVDVEDAGSRRAIYRFDLVDWVLCTLLASTCAYVAGGGFYVSEAVQNDPLLIVLFPLVMTGLLVLQQRGGKLRILGLAVFAILIVAMLGWAISSAPEGQAMVDVEANPTIFILVLIVSTVLTFFLSRTTVGLVALVLLVVVDVFVVEFLYQNPAYTVISCVAIGALLALLAFSRIRLACFKDSAKNVPGGVAVGSAVGSLAVAAIFVGAACAVFVLVIAPLNPNAGELPPFRTPISYDTPHLRGIVDIDEVVDEDLKSREQEGDETSSTAGDEDSAEGGDAPPAESLGSSLQQFFRDAFNIDSPRELFDPHSYESYVPVPLIIIAIIVALIAAAIITKLRLRARWLAQCAQLPAGKQVIGIYDRLQQRLATIGVPRNDVETPEEYLVRNRASLEAVFEGEGEVERFAKLTSAFEDARYGHLIAHGTDVPGFLELVRRFPKHASHYLGKPGYLRRFFKI